FELQQVLVDTWSANRKTALMVTHDVDEALYLSDRVAMMTSGPNARLGGILGVPFERPRDRVALAESTDYDAERAELIGFLEREAKDGHASKPSVAPPAAVEPQPPSALLLAGE